MEFQNNSREKLGLERLDYFNLEYSVVGIDHGILFKLENANVLRVLIDENLINDYFPKIFTFKNIIKNRKRMIETINHITFGNIEAIDNLENVILEKYYIFQYIEKVRERLDLAENDTIITYEKKTNRQIIV